MKEKLRQHDFGFMNWGGKRRGAGRKPKGERAGVTHAKRERLAARLPLHITMRLREGSPSLRSGEAHAVVQASLVKGTKDSFRVVEYSVQRDHLHLIVEVDDELALARGMIGLTVRLARSLNRLWERTGNVFPDRFHVHVLRTPREVRHALIYVIQNARKHGAWRELVPDPFSSGPWFEGWALPRAILALSSGRLLARARTWLLAIGWMKAGGRLRLAERPAAA